MDVEGLAFPAANTNGRERLFEFAIENSTDGVLIGLPPPDRRIVYANEAFCRMTGHLRDEVVGRMASIMDGPATDKVELAQLLSHADQGQPYTAELTAYRRNGTTFCVEQTIAALKDANGRTLYWFSLLRDVTARRAMQEQLEHLALHDSLTGLPNRLLLHDRLEQALLSSKRGGAPMTLMFLDLDAFKQVNDEMGHQAGDEVLRDVAKRLRGGLRETDTVARVGGDEFALILPGCSSAGSRRAAGKIVDAFQRPFQVGSRSFSVGASVGVATYPENGAQADQLMAHADSAMYAAKRSRAGYLLYGEVPS